MQGRKECRGGRTTTRNTDIKKRKREREKELLPGTKPLLSQSGGGGMNEWSMVVQELSVCLSVCPASQELKLKLSLSLSLSVGVQFGVGRSIVAVGIIGNCHGNNTRWRLHSQARQQQQQQQQRLCAKDAKEKKYISHCQSLRSGWLAVLGSVTLKLALNET